MNDCQVSSDLSVLDFDIPFAVIYVMAAGIELVAIIGIMASVTWQVLVVAILAVLATKYVQVNQIFDEFASHDYVSICIQVNHDFF